MLCLRNQQVSRQTSKDGRRSIPLNFMIISIVMLGRVENTGAARQFVDAARPCVPNYHAYLGARRDSVSLNRNPE